jgi:hypothetical protein
MKFSVLTLAACGLLTCGASLPSQSSQQTTPFIKGDYVEARSASVFAGACHYNSELMTSGRDAVMAWNITDGYWNGTSLAGVRVMAVVAGDDNLGLAGVARKSEIAVDSHATAAQVAAVVGALKAQCGSSLGDVVAVRRTAVNFSDVDRKYTVAAAGFATLITQAMPDDECCKQPSMVWYTPLVPVTGRKVGYTTEAAALSSTIGDTWDRRDENSAFYGPFTFIAGEHADAAVAAAD